MIYRENGNYKQLRYVSSNINHKYLGRLTLIVVLFVGILTISIFTTATARGNGGIRSCSVSRSRATETPTTSGRVARNWPSFTQDGPSRVRPAARPSPPDAPGRSMRRASRTSARAGAGTSASRRDRTRPRGRASSPQRRGGRVRGMKPRAVHRQTMSRSIARRAGRFKTAAGR